MSKFKYLILAALVAIVAWGCTFAGLLWFLNKTESGYKARQDAWMVANECVIYGFIEGERAGKANTAVSEPFYRCKDGKFYHYFTFPGAK
jgi:hypothetical protein